MILIKDPTKFGKEAFLRGQPCEPWKAYQEANTQAAPSDWMRRWSKGWHVANIDAPVCMTTNTDESAPKNRANMSPAFVTLDSPGTLVESKNIAGEVMEITEDVPGFVTSSGGMVIGPFATEAAAAKHGTPRKVQLRRRRYVNGGIVSPGSPTAYQIDENDPTTELVTH